MKKIIALISVVLFTIAILAFAAEDTKPELRPAQKLMQARAAWLGEINKNLGNNNFDAIAKDANELSAQTKKVGENHPNPLGKDLTLGISSLAMDVSAAAVKRDADTVKIKLGEIKGNCGECHAKIRDKK
jgi:cytochrome c556